MQPSSDSLNPIGPWYRLAALALVVAGLGLPINDLYRYALLVLAAVPIFVGVVSRRPWAWFAAVAIVAAAVVGQTLLPAPRIEEGHNVFIVDGRGGALQRELPADAFRLMAAEFDARYPPERRCDPREFGCWRSGGLPDRAYAFSADAIYDRPIYSRRVTDIDFADPVWLRLGFVNEAKYNWTGTSDLQRSIRERWWMVLHPWRFTMPYFVMVSLSRRLRRQPAVLAAARSFGKARRSSFAAWRHAEFACRPIESGDVGRRIFGVSIASPLAISLEPTIAVQLRRLVAAGAGADCCRCGAAIAGSLATDGNWRCRSYSSGCRCWSCC